MYCMEVVTAILFRVKRAISKFDGKGIGTDGVGGRSRRRNDGEGRNVSEEKMAGSEKGKSGCQLPEGLGGGQIGIH